MRRTREWLRVLSFAIAAGILVPFAFAWIVDVWGGETLAWPGFRTMMVFVYPFASVPIRTSVYGVFVLTAVLNGWYYACLALLAIYMRRQMASGLLVAMVVLLVVLVAGPVLHVAFRGLDAIQMR
jgi:hypothetical protein